MMDRRALATCVLLLSLCACLTAAERKEVRLLYDFEDPAELEGLKKQSENITFDIVQDNGVTHGANCCRLVIKKGGEYADFSFAADKIKDWGNFDYIAFDIFGEAEEKTAFSFELWDGLTKGYPTRATFEPNVVRHGKNTIVIPINRAKRNGKEGRDWTELEAKDKIQMDALTKVKFFLGQPKAQDLTWWMDNVRLLQEDALGGKMKVELPATAKGYLLGHRANPLAGFIIAEKPGADDRGFTLGGNVENCGKHWPDPLTGEGVFNPGGEMINFETKLPDGEYWAWLAAGMTIDSKVKNPHFLLKLGEETLADESPKGDEIFGEKYLFRFLKTQYSERPDALYLDYIDRMFPVYEKKVKVTGGKLSVQAANHFLAALIVMPAAEEVAFKKLSADIRTERMKTFYAQVNLDPQKKPQKKDGDGAYVCFVPDDTTSFHPSTGPNDAERARKNIDLAAAPGERLIFRVGLTPFEDLGKCKLTLSNLKGPAEIPATAARVYFQDYRVRGDSVHEAALMPSSELKVEKGISSCWWLWMKIPDDAAAGDYSGAVTVTPANGKAVTIPVALKVYPFKLEENLPYSFGMYYSPAHDKKVTAEQVQFMRELGMTATCVGSGAIQGVNGDTVNVTFDTTMWDLAKAAGMGRHPQQFMMGNSLGAARTIGRRLGAKVDADPGSEFALPNFKAPYMDFAKKFAEFIKQQALPVAVEIVDEPREVPNPWNRNLKFTNTYGDWLKEAGIFPTFVTPMGDTQSGLDYTSLTDHSDIVSTHAGKGSERLMKMTPEKKKMLWLYNTGMDRLSWGFYNWRVGSIGRWEWHFCFNEGGTNNGYVNEDEWFNPFTSNDAFAPHGPADYPGHMLFKSVFMTCSEGITDSAYIVTLEKAIAAAEKDAAKAATATKAKEFLDSLKTTIPFLPGVKNIASATEGALVGKGLNADASQCDQWRRKIAEFIIGLK
jgi:hypothetical protein